MPHPAPSPRHSAATITTTRPSSFIAVEMFCTHFPEATPLRLMSVNSPISAMPSAFDWPSEAPINRPRYSPHTTPMAAMAAV